MKRVFLGATMKGWNLKMGDVFIERMIKKKFESTDVLILLGIVVGMIVAVLIGFVVGFMLVPFPMLTILVA